MTEPGPVFNQVNIIARDWDASLAFYRLLGFELDSDTDWPPGSNARHTAVTTSPMKSMVEFDNPPMVRLYADESIASASALLGFAFPSADAVDAACSRVAAAGHHVVKAPHDAFWGARYAIVTDPDGNLVGLMGPRDRSRGYVPAVDRL